MIKPVYFDDTLPEEQMATVWHVDAQSKVVAYNGVDIGDVWICSKIPAGDSEFVMDIIAGTGIRYIADNVIYRYNFQAGKVYTVDFAINDEGDWGMNIYDGPPTQVGWVIEENFITFVPFLNLARNSGNAVP
jgi:hypothetical protein